jgi:hypothetical protein
MICLLLCFALQGSAKSHQKLAVTGKLTRVMAIGGESTGWAIQFESETTIDEKPMHSLEVAGPSEQLQQLENKIVTAKGTLTYKHGVETGDRPVLKISSIKEAASK